MKSIMYHYVQTYNPDMPYFRYLDVSHFEKQIDYLNAHGGLVDIADYNNFLNGRLAIGKHMLTFDDGLSCHYEHVFPILKKNDCIGVFCVATQPIKTLEALDVHKIHYIIGKFGGAKARADLEKLISIDMLDNCKMDKLFSKTYSNQQNEEDDVLYFKRILNYCIKDEYKNAIINELFLSSLDGISEEQFCKKYYLSIEDIRAMDRAGMIIGSHSVSHRVFSNLAKSDQEKEIKDSISFLSDILNKPIHTFCYPYGGFHTFTNETEDILDNNGVLFSMNVEDRDITKNDFLLRPQAIPRYDCNSFPHGEISCGS